MDECCDIIMRVKLDATFVLCGSFESSTKVLLMSLFGKVRCYATAMRGFGDQRVMAIRDGHIVFVRRSHAS